MDSVHNTSTRDLRTHNHLHTHMHACPHARMHRTNMVTSDGKLVNVTYGDLLSQYRPGFGLKWKEVFPDLGEEPKRYFLADTPFVVSDVGKTMTITGEDVLVDGVNRDVNWRTAKHPEHLTGTIKSVEEIYKGKVVLEGGEEFENGATKIYAEITNTTLGAALHAGQLEFSEEEWERFGVSNLCAYSFIEYQSKQDLYPKFFVPDGMCMLALNDTWVFAHVYTAAPQWLISIGTTYCQRLFAREIWTLGACT